MDAVRATTEHNQQRRHRDEVAYAELRGVRADTGQVHEELHLALLLCRVRSPGSAG
ncbi:hypothetical protein ACTWQF_17555 [Streptomyces sp. 8N114]|uniref:hypothetical protein n=1 Tax=Streptomyces sp. 8N114 TaxID=3457419 RepID=UPI003FCFCBDA